MDRVLVVTDSSARLGTGSPRRPGLRTVPITIYVGAEELRGDLGGTAAMIREAFARDEPMKSSAPSAVEYLGAIEAGGAHDVLVITPAAELTVMYRNACLAAELTDARVSVLDSRTAAAAQGLVVEVAVQAARAGASLEDVERIAAAAARGAELVAALDGIEHVRRSGRVPSRVLGLAEHLGVRPVFRLRDGGVERLALPRSDRSALRRVVAESNRIGLTGSTRRVVFHAGCVDRAEALVGMIGGADHVTEFSPAMTIHTGPGVVGVAWIGARAEGPIGAGP